MNEDDTIKKQVEYENKERMIAEKIYSVSFLDLLDQTTEEMIEEDELKYTELQQQLMNKLIEVIDNLNTKFIDLRVLTMVFAKCLLAFKTLEEQ